MYRIYNVYAFESKLKVFICYNYLGEYGIVKVLFNQRLTLVSVRGDIVEAAGLTSIERCVINFGKEINDLNLTDIVIDMYDSALQESSRIRYRTGQRA